MGATGPAGSSGTRLRVRLSLEPFACATTVPQWSQRLRVVVWCILPRSPLARRSSGDPGPRPLSYRKQALRRRSRPLPSSERPARQGRTPGLQTPLTSARRSRLSGLPSAPGRSPFRVIDSHVGASMGPSEVRVRDTLPGGPDDGGNRDEESQHHPRWIVMPSSLLHLLTGRMLACVLGGSRRMVFLTASHRMPPSNACRGALIERAGPGSLAAGPTSPV